jgi:hypothetical protein
MGGLDCMSFQCERQELTVGTCQWEVQDVGKTRKGRKTRDLVMTVYMCI